MILFWESHQFLNSLQPIFQVIWWGMFKSWNYLKVLVLLVHPFLACFYQWQKNYFLHKMQNIFPAIWYFDTAILWYCNTLILQYFDTALLWYFDTSILWHCNFLLGEHLIQAENQLEASPRPTKSPGVDFSYTKTVILMHKKYENYKY